MKIKHTSFSAKKIVLLQFSLAWSVVRFFPRSRDKRLTVVLSSLLLNSTESRFINLRLSSFHNLVLSPLRNDSEENPSGFHPSAFQSPGKNASESSTMSSRTMSAAKFIRLLAPLRFERQFCINMFCILHNTFFIVQSN